METVEVVIKMPKSEYEELTRGGYTWWGRHGEYIKKGTVLPKGHGRIGDLDELHHTFKELCNAYSINNLSFMSDIDMNFDLAPIIIEADKDGE